LFHEGRIILVPVDGVYEARAELLPLVAVSDGGAAVPAVAVSLVVRLA